ncbi:MAG: hypothetical protein A3C49_00395 [Candidatus Doudnabacteria bacterium RIFCSPHIGHO2_02_FULL_42_25]|uniref:Uncharacterized protein n=1 Tax=Candidatus Doudnabacteria bacterium RIFCSPHIGHO2_01_FULL_41_86 TaxID=1817821 RepID=A0A1F5N8A6_9BACT|nr:MAG: hypothetical protein A2717_03435 [Candidatus Doudnabacteria bacterium RIFCSPHIGHO2_01_FULL_41_86]OGE85696.1 MAG: hypothetical protein A3E28_02765 [Candidatus Doudnabacteria bacterium RIFCSPHIGHO2_12_FULL_42_22]OGE87191.1 MAG: hypothetical protein A3C49_00395 [Candidatus Doudnabacteria bacterium RIFCSPHIGHO2_02_FULL_42_25]
MGSPQSPPNGGMDMRIVGIVLFVVATLGCDKKSPLAPEMTPEQRAVTPSAEVDVITITAKKIAEGKASLILGENFNWAFGDDGGLSDWNGAKIYVVRKCDDETKATQVGTEYSNSVDPVTKKRTVLFPSVALCPGNILRIRIRVEAADGSGIKELRFPFAEHVRRDPVSLELVRETYDDSGLVDRYYTYIRGAL